MEAARLCFCACGCGNDFGRVRTEVLGTQSFGPRRREGRTCARSLKPLARGILASELFCFAVIRPRFIFVL